MLSIHTDSKGTMGRCGYCVLGFRVWGYLPPKVGYRQERNMQYGGYGHLGVGFRV